MVVQVMQMNGYIVSKVNCDASDSFDSIWRKALRDITYTNKSVSPGFLGDPVNDHISREHVAGVLTDEVRRTLTMLGAHAPVLIILDEFDRLLHGCAASVAFPTQLKPCQTLG